MELAQAERQKVTLEVFVPTALTCLRRGTWGGLALVLGSGSRSQKLKTLISTPTTILREL